MRELLHNVGKLKVLRMCSKPDTESIDAHQLWSSVGSRLKGIILEMIDHTVFYAGTSQAGEISVKMLDEKGWFDLFESGEIREREGLMSWWH